jgi:hypothetical protein
MLRLLTLLVQKNGHFSKTSVMLWIAFGVVAFKYLFAGQVVAGYAIGPFDEMEAITFLGLVGGVYVGANAKPRAPGDGGVVLDTVPPSSLEALGPALVATASMRRPAPTPAAPPPTPKETPLAAQDGVSSPGGAPPDIRPIAGEEPQVADVSDVDDLGVRGIDLDRPAVPAADVPLDRL